MATTSVQVRATDPSGQSLLERLSGLLAAIGWARLFG